MDEIHCETDISGLTLSCTFSFSQETLCELGDVISPHNFSILLLYYTDLVNGLGCATTCHYCLMWQYINNIAAYWAAYQLYGCHANVDIMATPAHLLCCGGHMSGDNIFTRLLFDNDE